MQRLYIGDLDVSSLLKKDGGYVYVPFEEVFDFFTGSLAVYYDFGKLDSYAGSGSVVNDIKNNIDATIQEGASGSFSATEFSGSFFFNDTSVLTLDSPASTGTGEWSTIIWFKKLTTDSVESLFRQDLGGTQSNKILFYESGDINPRFTGGVDNRFDFGFLTGSMLNEWHQLNIVRDANGGISGSIDDNPLIASGHEDNGSANWNYIGTGLNDEPWDGYIGNVMIYTSSLSTFQTSQIYSYFSQRRL